MSKRDIDSLVKKSQSGDIKAFEELIFEYEGLIFNTIFRLNKNFDDSKEISQEVFIKIFQNIKKFKAKSSFKTWIYRIAINTAIDEGKKRNKIKTLSLDKEYETRDGSLNFELEDSAPSVEASLLEKELKENIEAALDKLNYMHKEVIVLRELQNLSYSEIAEILDTNEGTVKSRLSRARINLKEILLNMEQFK